ELPHGTPGPGSGNVFLADADGDVLSLTVAFPPQHGTVVVSGSGNTFTSHFLPTPTTVYDPVFGIMRTISTFRGTDQFTLRAFDGLDITDREVQIDVFDLPPEPDTSPIVGDIFVAVAGHRGELLHDDFFVHASD